MAINPPTFTMKLGLALVPGRLERFEETAVQRAERVNTLIGATPEEIRDRFPVEDWIASVNMQRLPMVAGSQIEEVRTAKLMRNVCCFGAAATILLADSFPTLSKVVGAATLFGSCVLYQKSAQLLEDRHGLDTVVQTNLPPNVAQQFFAP